MDPALNLPNYDSQPHVEGKSRFWSSLSYTKLNVLGEGIRRICWRASLNNGKIVAVVKEEFKSHETLNILHYTQVVEILKGHPNVVNVDKWFWTTQRKDKNYKFYQIQTCYINNLIVGINSGIFETQPKWIAIALMQLSEGLAFIHSKGIVVNDLKLDNIFYRIFNGIQFSYGDFGGADLPNKQAVQYTFTDNYCSPNRLDDKLNTQADDVFSFGICSGSIQQPKVRRRNFPYAVWAKTPCKPYAEYVEDYASSLDDTNWKPMIVRMLAYERIERPSAQEIKNVFVNFV